MRIQHTAALAAAAALAACASAEVGDQTPTPSIVGAWSLDGPSPQPTITFAGDGTVSGVIACNSFAGRYTQDGAVVRLSDLNMTLVGCADQAAVENHVRPLLSAESARIVGGDARHIRFSAGGREYRLTAR